MLQEATRLPDLLAMRRAVIEGGLLATKLA
jgi:hypothetical protein